MRKETSVEVVSVFVVCKKTWAKYNPEKLLIQGYMYICKTATSGINKKLLRNIYKEQTTSIILLSNRNLRGFSQWYL